MTDHTRPSLRCDECGYLCDDWTAFDGGVLIVCAPCLIDAESGAGQVEAPSDVGSEP